MTTRNGSKGRRRKISRNVSAVMRVTVPKTVSDCSRAGHGSPAIRRSSPAIPSRATRRVATGQMPQAYTPQCGSVQFGGFTGPSQLTLRSRRRASPTRPLPMMCALPQILRAPATQPTLRMPERQAGHRTHTNHPPPLLVEFRTTRHLRAPLTCGNGATSRRCPRQRQLQGLPKADPGRNCEVSPSLACDSRPPLP